MSKLESYIPWNVQALVKTALFDNISLKAIVMAKFLLKFTLIKVHVETKWKKALIVTIFIVAIISLLKGEELKTKLQYSW